MNIKIKIGTLITSLLLIFVVGINTPIAGQETDPYKATAAQAPSMADYPLEFTVVSQKTLVNGVSQYIGWTPVIRGRMLGRTRAGDAVIVELSQSGKLIHTLRVGLRGNGGQTWFEEWEIRGDDTKDVLTATGQITATFKYVNDAEGKTIPLAVRQFNVARLATYDEGKSVWKYGALYDDLLGFSYLVQRIPDGQAPFVWVYTWMNLEHDSIVKDISYRIEVDGKMIQLDDAFDANQNHESIATIDQYEEVFNKAKNDRFVNRHNMYLVVFRPKLLWGKKTDLASSSGWLWMIDYPGKWALKIRIGGQVVRELRFTVMPNGQIQPHAEQDPTTQGFLNLGPGRFFAETYFSNPNTFDMRFNPDAIRAGVLYGRLWISSEVKEGMLKMLPPKNPGKMPFPQQALPPTK